QFEYTPRIDWDLMEAIIGAGFAFLIGVVGLWTGFKQLRNRTMLSRWPTTQGRVIERGTCQPYLATATQSAFRHAPLVRYVYQVGGKEFTNNQFERNESNNRNAARKHGQKRRPPHFLTRWSFITTRKTLANRFCKKHLHCCSWS